MFREALGPWLKVLVSVEGGECVVGGRGTDASGGPALKVGHVSLLVAN